MNKHRPNGATVGAIRTALGNDRGEEHDEDRGGGDSWRTVLRRQLGFTLRHRLAISVAAHLLFFAASLLAAFALAYNFDRAFARAGGDEAPVLWGWFASLYLPLLAMVLPIKAAVFSLTGQYRGSWRYVGLYDLFGVVWSSLISSVLFVLAYFVVENVWNQLYSSSLIDRSSPPLLRQSMFLLDFGVTIGFVCAARVLVRFYYEEVRVRPAENVRRVLIIGAGDEAESLLREVRRMPDESYHVVGLLDDRATQQSGRIHGADILGGTDRLAELVVQHRIDEVLIALPETNPREIRRWVETCSNTGVRFRTIPSVSAVMEGRVQVNHIRDVDIADLLGRKPVQLDTEQIGRELRGHRIVVTGAGGSIGSELCRQIAEFEPRRLILMERAENALFEIDRELRSSYPQLDVVACIADVCDRERVRRVFAAHRPGLVFHAAAHKHVPMMELNIGEAIKNNIGGTQVVAEAADEAVVAKMVLISTDKAINPTSIMGCSKRVAEMVVQGLDQRSKTQFVTVRFGNVLGSDGSVVPIFKRQIAHGGPVTVTHPDMRRYFMTIPEASQLVLQAGVMGNGGEIFVLDMGEPIRIVDLARDMITLSGLRPGVDIEIEYTSIRPGEKLFEELSMDGEDIAATRHPYIGIHKHRPEDWDAVFKGVEQLLEESDTAADAQRKQHLTSIVPEYQPS